MTDLPLAVRSGFYARKQIFNNARLIAWTHRSRFDMAVALAKELGARRVLDYGAGDGTFLAMLAATDAPPDLAVGAELTPDIVDDCNARFGDVPGLRFMLIDALDAGDEQHRSGHYDAIFCMEVFEHVVGPEALLARLERLLAPGGALVISVPIETGLPVVVKQAARRVAGWRGIGHYPGTTGYSPLELLKSVCAGRRQHLARPVFTRPDGSTFHDHKAFNWRVLRDLIGARFDLERETTSPLPWLGPQLGTQRWFVARKRAGQ
jgi:SAM-dependent methyltransferase